MLYKSYTDSVEVIVCISKKGVYSCSCNINCINREPLCLISTRYIWSVLILTGAFFGYEMTWPVSDKVIHWFMTTYAIVTNVNSQMPALLYGVRIIVLVYCGVTYPLKQDVCLCHVRQWCKIRILCKMYDLWFYVRFMMPCETHEVM